MFTPTQKAIDKALAVIAAIKEAESKGSGVIAVNGKWWTDQLSSAHSASSTSHWLRA